MGKFFMKSFFIVAILFFGVLLGMQQANLGIKKIKGYDDSRFNSAFQVTENVEGKYETVFLGKKVTEQELQEKEKKLQKLKNFNLFSSIGRSIGQTVTLLFEKIIELFSSAIDTILN